MFQQENFFLNLPRGCKAQPCHVLLGYPFCNTAAHTDALPTREGIYVMIPMFEEEPNGIAAHSMPPVRRRGGFNLNTTLQISSTERLWQHTGYEA